MEQWQEFLAPLSHAREAERKKAISAILYCTILLKRRRRRRERRRDSLSHPPSRFLLSHPIPNPPAPSHRFSKIVLPAELIPILRPPTSLFHANWPQLQKEKKLQDSRNCIQFQWRPKERKEFQFASCFHADWFSQTDWIERSGTARSQFRNPTFPRRSLLIAVRKSLFRLILGSGYSFSESLSTDLRRETNKDAKGIKTLFSRVSLPLVYSSRQIRELFFLSLERRASIWYMYWGGKSWYDPGFKSSFFEKTLEGKADHVFFPGKCSSRMLAS